jgi:hypothetical protein
MSTANVLTLPNGVTLKDVFTDGDKHYVTIAGFDGDEVIVSTKVGVVRVAKDALPEGVATGIKLFVNEHLSIVGNNMKTASKASEQKPSTLSGCSEHRNQMSLG